MRMKDRVSASELRELLALELKDFYEKCGMEVPKQFPDELEGLFFSLRILNRTINVRFTRTQTSSREYRMVHAYAWWTVRVITKNFRRNQESPEEESQVEALVEFLIKETRWTDHEINRSMSPGEYFMTLLECEQQVEFDLPEDDPEQDADQFGHLIGWS